MNRSLAIASWLFALAAALSLTIARLESRIAALETLAPAPHPHRHRHRSRSRRSPSTRTGPTTGPSPCPPRCTRAGGDPMADNLDWDGDGAIAHVRSRPSRTSAARRWRSCAGPRSCSRSPGRADRAGARREHRKGTRIYGAVRSAPGEPPRKQTGRLRASVTSEVERERAYGPRRDQRALTGRTLEMGTKQGLAPRPWLRRALAEMQARVDQLLG